MLILSRDQVRDVDRRAVEELGIPGVVLMENAGLNATAILVEWLMRETGIAAQEMRAGILCGGGNNGGDGYVVARQLFNRDAKVTIYAVKDPAELRGDAATNHRICANLGLDIRPVLTAAQLEEQAGEWSRLHVMVDAMLGTGFHGEVREPMAAVICRLNETKGPRIVAVDVPSGLDCQTGRPGSATVEADLTVTFVALKKGLDADEARKYLGRVVTASIGVPESWVRGVTG